MGASSVTDPDSNVIQPVTTLVPENRTIMTISSDTQLTVNAAFTQSNNKVGYCIGSIPALGRVTAAQGHKTVKGDDDTRFMEQLKVHYYITVLGVERRINSIQDQHTLTVDHPFPGGIGTKSQMTFRGKVGTGEVSTGAALQRPAPDHCFCGQFRSTKPGNLAIFIDDMKRPVLQTKISLRKGEASASCSDADTDRHILDMQGNAYIGFTAATGGERTGIAYDEFGVTTTIDFIRGTYGTSFFEFTKGQASNERVGLKRGAAQIHEILSWQYCSKMGCVPV